MLKNLRSDSVKIGAEAPEFSLMDENGATWSLREQRGKVVLLIFYPGNETFVCTKQLCSLRDNWSKYLDTKAEIVAVSVSDWEANRSFVKEHRLPLSILADTDRAITRLYASHPFFPLSFMRGLSVIDGRGIIRTHQTMLRAFRPNDHDIVLRLYEARSDASQDRRDALKQKVRTLLLR